MTNKLAVCGGSGFIGRHLMHALGNDPDAEVRLLVHCHRPSEMLSASNVVAVSGDLMRPDSLGVFVTTGCTVVNLAYMPAKSRDENLAAMTNLVEACLNAKVRRMVHLSTATVVGAATDNVITEATPPDPRTDYERTKLEIERLLAKQARSAFELVILRPAAVFGPGGKNLVKLAASLLDGNAFENYIRSCFHGHRRMNLVCVENVVAAIRFVAVTDARMAEETFIVSDDDEQLNNYRDVELLLMSRFGRDDYAVSPVSAPRRLQSTLLRFAGRSNVNPQRVYYSRKLKDAGFKKAVTFAAGLTSFAEWYRQDHGGSLAKTA